MKKTLLLSTFAAAAFLTASAQATLTLNLTAGILYQSNGTTPVPDGTLLQIIASTTDNSFTAPSASSFVGGSSDDTVVASYALNHNTVGSAGGDFHSIVLTLSGNWTAGDQLLLRWWPTLTTSSSSPGANTTYGQFRTDAVENGSTTAWVTPADGQTVNLNFLDTAAGGTEPNGNGQGSTNGAASLTVVPEPSTYGMLGMGIVAGGVYLARRRKVTA